MHAVVIIPTYNERENIETLLPAVLEHDVDVLVVDDNSPDDTADAVRELQTDYPSRLHLLSGEKRGLGAAYRRGMQHALEELGADAVVEMDADHSHDPADVPRLLAALKRADFAIGSRYTSGGEITGWSAWRRFVSFGANLVARWVAGIWSVRDCTAGFRAIKREVLERVGWDALSTAGYGFQVALLHSAVKNGFSVEEVPVVFTDREVGESKLGFSDAWEGLWLCVRLGWQSYGRLAKFLLVGASGMLVNLGLFSTLFRLAELPVWGAWIVALEASILWNFAFNDKWTFKDRRREPWSARLGKYHLTSFGGVVINFLVFGALLTYTGLLEELSNLFAIAAATSWNFLVSHYWAWKE